MKMTVDIKDFSNGSIDNSNQRKPKKMRSRVRLPNIVSTAN